MRLFQNEVNDIVLKAVKKLCDVYDIDFEEAKEVVNVKLGVKTNDLRIIKKHVPQHPPELRCMARMLHEVEIKQCSHRRKHGDICGFHRWMEDRGRLRYGRMTDPLPMELSQKVLDNKRKAKLY